MGSWLSNSLGTFCQSLQYVYEEKVMAGDVQALININSSVI